MDVQTYLGELAGALSALPPGERDEALAFYAEYLEEVGEDGRAEAMSSLGTPKSLAAQIKADIAIRSLDGESGREQQPLWFAPQPPRSAQATQPSSAPSKPPAPSEPPAPPSEPSQSGPAVPSAAVPSAAVPPAYAPPAGTPPSQPSWRPWQPTSQQPAPQQSTQSSGTKSAMPVVLIVLLAIFALPIGLPLAAAVLALVIAVFAGLLALFVAFIAMVIALLVCGVLASVCGFILLFSEFAAGLFYLGFGIASLGLSLLLAFGFIKLGHLLIKGVAYLFNNIRRRLSKKNTEASHA
ncbi:MAG: DUF1700 domain-containing protein [Coriobacteriales bacterium]|jgi:uncharacterized membrane protein|nr:DUF1700 domain-containing protein [Coriobacteriales bacterium]